MHLSSSQKTSSHIHERGVVGHPAAQVAGGRWQEEEEEEEAAVRAHGADAVSTKEHAGFVLSRSAQLGTGARENGRRALLVSHQTHHHPTHDSQMCVCVSVCFFFFFCFFGIFFTL